MGGANKNDGALSWFKERHRHAGKHHGGNHVGVERVFQETLGVAIDGLAVHVGGVVDERVEFASMSDRGGKHDLAVCLHSDVALNNVASLTQFILDRLEFFEAPSADRDPGTLAAEASRTVCADARSTPCYQNRHVLEISHWALSAVSPPDKISFVAPGSFVIRANLPVASWEGGYRETGSALPRNLPSLR